MFLQSPESSIILVDVDLKDGRLILVPWLFNINTDTLLKKKTSDIKYSAEIQAFNIKMKRYTWFSKVILKTAWAHLLAIIFKSPYRLFTH